MRVSEIRRNTVSTTKTNTKAKAFNYAPKQAFEASLVSKKGIIFSVGRAICPVLEFFEKMNPAKLFKKQEKWEHDWVGFAKDLTP